MAEKRIVLRSGRGKTLVVYARLDSNGVLEEIVFGGDYFAYPEDSIIMLEEKLKGLGLVDALRTIEDSLRDTVLLGISIDDLKEAVRRVFED